MDFAWLSVQHIQRTLASAGHIRSVVIVFRRPPAAPSVRLYIDSPTTIDVELKNFGAEQFATMRRPIVAVWTDRAAAAAAATAADGGLTATPIIVDTHNARTHARTQLRHVPRCSTWPPSAKLQQQ